MDAMKTILISVLLIFGLLVNSNAQVVNGSFEEDFGLFTTEGWQNNGGLESADTPPNGGFWSLSLCGGCMWVSCSQKIPQIESGEIWELRCQAKVIGLYSGGNVSWSDGYAGVFVSDSNWTQINIIDTFFHSPSDTISIILEGGGGFAGTGGILVDLVEIENLGNIITSEQIPEEKHKICLLQNFPNPFEDETNISFELNNAANVSLKIYSLVGQEVETFADGWLNSGMYQYIWKPSEEISSGIYFCKLKVKAISEASEDYVLSKKMIKN